MAEETEKGVLQEEGSWRRGWGKAYCRTRKLANETGEKRIEGRGKMAVETGETMKYKRDSKKAY